MESMVEDSVAATSFVVYVGVVDSLVENPVMATEVESVVSVVMPGSVEVSCNVDKECKISLLKYIIPLIKL